ncbi:MAG: ATP-binding protein [Fuerstiella sp.]
MPSQTPEFWSRYQPVRDPEQSHLFRKVLAEDGEGVRRVVYEVDWTADDSSNLQSRIRHEAQRFATISDDRWCAPIEFDFSGQTARIVCPWLPLPRLTDRLKSGLSLAETLAIAGDLLQVLQKAHQTGLVFRCIRPDDVWLDSDGDTLHTRLGGCPPLMLLNGFHEDESPSETLTYSAPETLGALEYDVRAPADLYSLGILLFECLAGRPPFEAHSARELLFHHVTTPAPNLCQLNPEVPPPLNDVVRRLLQKHPRDRYQSAAGALFDIEQIKSVFCTTHGVCPTGPLVLGTRDHRESLIEPAFVGRDKDLDQLKTALEQTAEDESQTVLITAPSGVGKSRLLQEVSTSALVLGFRVLRAQGQNQVGLTPLATMQSALQACLQLIVDDAVLRSTLREQVRDYARELHAAAPQLATALHLDAPDARDRELSDRRIAVALATVLGNLSCGGQPVLILLDDAQWADDLTLSILDCWQLTGPQQTMLVVSSRPSDRLGEHVKTGIRLSAELELTLLNRDDSDLLLESMAGVLPSEILDLVWDMARGNPFVSSAVLRGLVESNVLTPADDEWHLDDDQLRHLQMSGEAAEVLKQRLVRLPRNSRELLAVGAVLGKQFSVETAATLTGLPYDKAIEYLAEPRDNHLIWEKAADGNCLFVHDQIREAVLQTLTDSEQRGIHRVAADHLAATSPDFHFEIACHYDAAGCPAEALAAAVKAADSARKRHALEIAQQQYEIALRSCHALDLEPDFEILNGMGEVLMLSGCYLEAQPMLEDALQHADSVMAEADISLKLGELAFKRDDKDEAVKLWESALRKLGGQLPPDWLMPLYTLKEIARQALHSLFPNLLVRSRTGIATVRDRLICRLYSRLAYGYWYLKGKVPLLFVHLRGMNLAEGFAPTAELAQAWSEHAPAMSLIPLRQRGIAYGRRSLEIRTALDDVWGQGQSLHFLAIALYAAGRFEECIDVGRRSVRILERAGDFWEKHIAQYQVAASLFRVGRLTEAVQLARDAYDSGLAVGDDQVCGNIIEVWARATNGDLPADIVQKELDRPRADVQGRAHVLLARGIQLIAEHRFDEAAETFEEGIRISRAAGITNCYTAPLYAWNATAVRRFLEEESPVIRRSRQKTIRRHRRNAWLAVLIALRFRSDLPHALRELAWSFIFLNRIHRAMFLLKWSIRAARTQSARYEILQSDLVLQQVRTELGYADAPQMLAESRERLSAFRNEQLPKRVTSSLSLVDRFDSLLESGRKIASAMEPEEIISATMTASQHLLRTDFCRVVSIDLNGEPVNVAESLQPLVLSCMATGEAEFSPTPNGEFRSLIVGPVFVRGTCVACLVAGNTKVRDLFGPNELKIISYITTICGAALENAEGFRNLRRLNENLEQIVSERTAAVEARSDELQKTADSLRQTQVELAAARDAAEVANQAKTDFLAHMSHEIRTPIGAVLGFTELLLNGEQPLHTEQRQHLERVHSNGSHLLHLLNDLLDLSRIEAGALKTEWLSCPPFSLLADIMASLQSRAVDKGLKLSLAADGPVPESIVTDPTRLRQIITNLVGNAIKFTASGSVQLVVRTLPDEQLLTIAVQDSGVGIAPEAHDTVFEPFQQADASVNRRFGGTGLGLPISRRLARALGGDISLTSAPDEGSTFTVTIATGPLNNVRMLTPTEAAETTGASHVSQVADVDLTGFRILVADDMDANREFFAHALERAGADVQLAANGQEAVDAWVSDPTDLILMDMRMPVMDGYTAAETLRQLGATLPIVALTANGMPEDELRCRAAGCNGYLTKPISLDALLTGICKQLQRNPEEHATRPTLLSAVPHVPPAPATIDSIDNRGSQDLTLPDDAFMRELSESLVQKLAATMPRTLELVATHDAAALAEQGHWMKGTGGTVGLPVISTIGRELEQAANADDFADAAVVIDRLKDTLDQLQQLRADETPADAR